MDNPIKELTLKICGYFINGKLDDFRDLLVGFFQIHKYRLESGEISFPMMLDAWHRQFARVADKIRQNVVEEMLEGNGERKEDFLKASVEWPYPIDNIIITRGRCVLFLERKAAIPLMMKSVLLAAPIGSSTGCFGMLEKLPTRKVCLLPPKLGDKGELSNYRAELVDKTLRRTLAYSNCVVIEHEHEADEETVKLQVYSLATPTLVEYPDRKLVKCGLVYDTKERRVATMSFDDYKNLRSTNMQSWAMHKGGLRFKADHNVAALLEQMGVSAVVFDFMFTKCQRPVNLTLQGAGNTKGANFVLYNSARLQSLLRSFENGVVAGIYKSLPSLEDVDFSLLDEHDEWLLLFSHLMQFPSIIERCVDNIELGVFHAYKLVEYIINLIADFSVYYRRVRILINSYEHLEATTHAKIYFIKAIVVVLNSALSLLDIKPVMAM